MWQTLYLDIRSKKRQTEADIEVRLKQVVIMRVRTAL